MAEQAGTGRSRRRWLVAAALVAGAAAVTLTFVTRDGGDRPAALALTAIGLALGIAATAALRRRRRPTPPSERAPRSAAERVNDAAFLLVVTAAWALLLAVSGPWPGLLTGVLVGACGQLAARA